jgi:hypothetical protein
VLLIPLFRGEALKCLASKRVPSTLTSFENSRACDRHHAPAEAFAQSPLSSFIPLHIRIAPGKRVENAVPPSKRVTAGLPITGVTALSVLRMVLIGGRTHLRIFE